MTTRWIKQITWTGLSFMTREAQRERMNRVFVNGDEINGPALGVQGGSGCVPNETKE